MDLTELNRATALPPAEAAPADSTRWRDIVQALSAEMAVPLTSALERVQELASSGRIDRASLRALGEELRQARRTAMTGQQLARMASAAGRQNPERLAIADVLRQALEARAAEAQARGIAVRLSLQPAEVMADATLLFNLVDNTLGWALAHARGPLDLQTDLKQWPVNARLICRFLHLHADQSANTAAREAAQAGLDTMDWRLVEQAAWACGLTAARRIEGVTTTLTFEFPRTVNDAMEGVSAVELGEGHLAKPLAGHHVLVVASRRDVRMQVRDALRNMGLIVDFVASVDEARDFCRGGLPQAIVIEAALRGDRFNELRKEVRTSGTDVAFIEIIEEGSTFEVSGFGGLNTARVGRDAIATSLAPALTFELAKVA